MKKAFLLSLVVGLSFLFNASADSLKSRFDFFAPVVKDKDDLTNTSPAGSLVYDSTDGAFFGLTNLGSWVELSQPTAAIARFSHTTTAQVISSSSFGTSAAVVNFNNELEDSNNAVTTGSNWNFEAPTSGLYQVSSMVTFSGDTWNAGDAAWIAVHDAGDNSIISYLAVHPVYASSSTTKPLTGMTLVRLSANDTIDVRVGQTSGSNRTLSNNGTLTYVNILKVAD